MIELQGYDEEEEHQGHLLIDHHQPYNKYWCFLSLVLPEPASRQLSGNVHFCISL
jgi:hypothetical protein